MAARAARRGGGQLEGQGWVHQVSIGDALGSPLHANALRARLPLTTSPVLARSGSRGPPSSPLALTHARTVLLGQWFASVFNTTCCCSENGNTNGKPALACSELVVGWAEMRKTYVRKDWLRAACARRNVLTPTRPVSASARQHARACRLNRRRPGVGHACEVSRTHFGATLAAGLLAEVHKSGKRALLYLRGSHPR